MNKNNRNNEHISIEIYIQTYTHTLLLQLLLHHCGVCRRNTLPVALLSCSGSEVGIRRSREAVAPPPCVPTRLEAAEVGRGRVLSWSRDSC
mmetsp:Transcript_62959/g.92321  ORF Transcript_62959/g.92321 Transcript_62959/m.92321 type:complete len:91 (-) Transcript_62959:478-750(-)